MNAGIETLKLAEICEMTGGELAGGDPDTGISSIATDSRNIPPRSVFIALKGDRFDAHDFLALAAESGAKAAVVSRVASSITGLAQIRVADTTRALGDIASGYRRRFRPAVAAITGTSGKTSCKEMLSAICRRRYRTEATHGNFNNLIGVPLTIFGLNAKTEKAIIEMGMNVPGEIAREAEIADPSIGVITAVGHGHLEGLGSINGVIRAKGELIEYLNGKNGTVVLNADHEHFKQLASIVKCNLVSVGEAPGASIRIRNISAKGYDPAVFTFRGIPVRLRLAGMHSVSNAFLAAATAVQLGVDPFDIVCGLSEVFPSPRRGVRHEVGGISIIDDSYNANPLSFASALAMLKCASANRKVLVMGDMLELGGESAALHEQVGRKVLEAGVDILIHRGEGGLAAAKVCHGVRTIECFSNDEITDVLEGLLLRGDIVLVKGSRGMKLDEVVDGITARRRSRKSDVIQLKR